MSVLRMMHGLLAAGAVPVDPIALSIWNKMTDAWNLDEAANSATYANGRSARNLTRRLGTTATRAGPAGAGIAADFSPTQGYLDTPNNTAMESGDRDLCFWGWCRVDTTADFRVLLSRWSALGGNMEWALYGYSGGGMGIEFVDAANVSQFFDFSALVPTDWTFFYVYQDRTTGKIGGRINGSPTGVEWSGTGYMRARATVLRVSGLGDTSGSTVYKHDGGVSKVGFAGGALLTDAEQAYLYNAGAGLTWQQIKSAAGL